jgi:hypothetical protein
MIDLYRPVSTYIELVSVQLPTTCIAVSPPLRGEYRYRSQPAIPVVKQAAPIQVGRVQVTRDRPTALSARNPSAGRSLQTRHPRGGLSAQCSSLHSYRSDERGACFSGPSNVTTREKRAFENAPPALVAKSFTFSVGVHS